ncbi:MAG: hypothetical protein ABSF23_13470 [Terracidiphilus sp.]|jgi:hypothetical protein
MKRSLVLACLILGFGGGLWAQVVDTTVCDIVKKPQAFDGKTVRIKGTVVAGFDQFVIRDAADPNCGYPVNAIWLDYPAGTKGKAGPAAILTVQPARNFTGKYAPPTRTPVTLDKSKDFKLFDSLLSQRHEKGTDMCLGCTRYEVTATLVGRLDAVADASLQYDSSGKIVGFGGFGNMNAYPARLVLQSVSDVTPKEIDFTKNDEEAKGSPQMGPPGPDMDVYAAIAAAQKATGALLSSVGALKDTAVKAAAVYGQPGDRTGVLEYYGPGNEASPKDEELGAKDSPDGVLFNCTFNGDRLEGHAFVIAVIHIGEHVSELRHPQPPNTAAPAIILEANAWAVSTLISITTNQKFLTLPGGYRIWDVNWPAAERNDRIDQVLKDYLAKQALLSQ